ncbi:cysteine desulfurase [Thalassotalea agarivorans]|uniref:cysteine desulfurase n=2 Tax=Thalassotalea agarivorans TaxID=349064 RepID=A0A1H9ZX36_THASX|nr:cysteine desulfurase [Thalassotalea agarivorans]
MPLVYFDNAATSQRLDEVISATQSYYETINANVHRSSHALSAQATSLYEGCRTDIAQWIGADKNEVVFTSGTTDAINLVATCVAKAFIQAGDEILISVSEHHANIVPWQLVCEQYGATLRVVDIDNQGRIDIAHFKQLLSNQTKLVAVSQLSNVVGKFNDVATLVRLAKEQGALTLIDGAQAIAHTALNVKSLDSDFYVFSAHKLYGPTGLGVLYGRAAVLEKLPPYKSGGEMIKKVSLKTGTTFNEAPSKFEAGTPNIAGVIAFARALNFIRKHHQDIAQIESDLTDYMWQALSNIEQVACLFEGKPDIPLFSFQIAGEHIKDIATALDAKGIAIRAGHHCAMPLMEYKQCSGSLRVSLAPYNTRAEVDYFVDALAQILSGEQHQVEPSLSIVSEFEQAKGWDQKHRLIMLYGRDFERMSREYRLPQNLIEGCESQAWLTMSEQNGSINLQGDSDARIIRGLMHIVFQAYQGKSAEQIAEFDEQAYFEQLGILQHLSPSRGNGLKAIVEKIKTRANELA